MSCHCPLGAAEQAAGHCSARLLALALPQRLPALPMSSCERLKRACQERKNYNKNAGGNPRKFCCNNACLAW